MTRRRLLTVFAAVFAVSMAARAPATVTPAQTTLTYRAYVVGAPVGDAEIVVKVADGGYRVSGVATSTSWLSAFTSWRNEFSAEGRLEDGLPQLAEFAYLERSGRSRRDVTVRDGALREIKNGKPRAERPPPKGMDVISALFVSPRCDADQVLHTGRHVYRLTLLERFDDGCRFQVADSDGDGYEVELRLGQRDGLLVPARITVRAWLTGWVELAPPQPTVGR